MKKKRANAKKEEKKIMKMSLEDIENEMTKLTLTADISNFFMNSKKIDMLDKIAQLKIKRLAIEQTMPSNEHTVAEPIKVEFVSANTQDINDRIARLEEDVDNSLNGDNHA